MFVLKKLLVIWLTRGDGEQRIGAKRVMCKMVDLVEREDEK